MAFWMSCRPGVFVAVSALLGACAGNPANTQGVASGGTAGTAPAGGGGTPGSAGGGVGGSSSVGGGGAGSSSAGSSSGGVSGVGGGAGGQSEGGTATGGGGGSALGGSAGATSTPTSFTCNQIIGLTLTREWFQAGFESDAGIIDGRWQLKAREHGYITEWANPTSDFWNEPPQSPCTAGAANPDHVVLTVLSWNPACCTTQPEWEAKVDAAVTNLVAKYSALKRIDLMTVIRGAGNKPCPTPPAANETISLPAELDAALVAIATKHRNLVFVAPKFEAHDCAAFNGGGPHLTTPGNTVVAQDIAALFDDLQ